MNERFAQNLLFAGLSEDLIAEKKISIETKELESGTVIFREGDPGQHLYLVAEGWVSISKKGRDGKPEVLATVGPNEFFGEMSLLDGKNRSATAEAVETTVLGKIEKEDFLSYVSHSAETALHFARLVTTQLRGANVQFMEKLIQTEKLNLLGTMMTSIVHDFRNPIATLGMLSHYLLAQDDDPKLVNLGKIASDSLEQIDSMVTELLDFSKGKRELHLEELAVADLFRKLDEQILKKVEGYGVKVIRRIECEGSIRVDEHSLLRLLLNIIRNALEAMKREGRLTVRATKEDGTFTLEIADTGCGIPPEILSRVFEPFVTHGKANGTGLGMSIAKSVVDAHKGTIRMESEVGSGTTCYISLPT